MTLQLSPFHITIAAAVRSKKSLGIVGLPQDLYEIVKPYGSRIVADQLLDMSLLLRNYHISRGSKTAAGQTRDDLTKSHLDTLVGPINQTLILPRECHTAAARSPRWSIAARLLTKSPTS